jgi:ABC-type cobalt transport system substrate-binding protein
MRKKMYKIIFVVIAMLLVLPILPGCSSAPPTSPAGADEIAEALILAYDANDYRAYLSYFDEAATGSVGQDWFSETSKIITKKIGQYIPNSKVVKEVKPSGNYTEVTYKAQYSAEPDGVTVIVDLSITDKGTYAAGIWFNSPKLFK